MSAAWAGIIVIGVSAVLLWLTGKHGHRVASRLPGWFHPGLYQAAILGMFIGGDTVAQSSLGATPERLERWAVSPFGPAGGHDVLVLAAVVVLAATVAGLFFEPGNAEAALAVCLPFVLLPAGGALAELAGWLPVVQWSAEFSHWIGG